jgi:hypothetical protein
MTPPTTPTYNQEPKVGSPIAEVSQNNLTHHRQWFLCSPFYGNHQMDQVLLQGPLSHNLVNGNCT